MSSYDPVGKPSSFADTLASFEKTLDTLQEKCYDPDSMGSASVKDAIRQLTEMSKCLESAMQTDTLGEETPNLSTEQVHGRVKGMRKDYEGLPQTQCHYPEPATEINGEVTTWYINAIAANEFSDAAFDRIKGNDHGIKLLLEMFNSAWSPQQRRRLTYKEYQRGA